MQDSLVFKKEFRKYIELIITAKGHAWCMDVKRERKKMAGLVGDVVEEIFK